MIKGKLTSSCKDKDDVYCTVAIKMELTFKTDIYKVALKIEMTSQLHTIVELTSKRAEITVFLKSIADL